MDLEGNAALKLCLKGFLLLFFNQNLAFSSTLRSVKPLCRPHG